MGICSLSASHSSLIGLKILNLQEDELLWLGYSRGVKLTFTGGHISLAVAFKGQNVILGLYKCNYSLNRGKELHAATG